MYSPQGNVTNVCVLQVRLNPFPKALAKLTETRGCADYENSKITLICILCVVQELLAYIPTFHFPSVYQPQCIRPYLNQVIKVVLPSYPAVVRQQTLRLVGDISCVQTFTVVELPFEQLESERERERQTGLQGGLAAIYTFTTVID